VPSLARPIRLVRCLAVLLLVTPHFTPEAAACSRSWNLEEMSPILVPIYMATPKSGAVGSLWTSEFLIHTGQEAYLNDACSFHFPHFGQYPSYIDRDVTFRAVLRDHPTNPGRLLYQFGKPSMGPHSYALSVRDLARQAESWGTEIPVVRANEFRKGTIHLLSVPTDPRFRLALRLYDPHATNRLAVTVRVYDQAAENLLRTFSLPLRTPEVNHFPEYNSYPAFPGYAEVNNFVDLAGAFVPETVRIEVVASDPNAGYWGFVSITNNETQQVTTITPQ